MKVVVAPSARSDVLGIWSYIAKDNVAAADRISERLEETINLLGPHPHLGERCPQFGADLRHVFVDVYVIFYAVDEVARLVKVKAVIHGARDLPTELARRGLS
jgi:toxin ParE1/3/4